MLFNHQLVEITVLIFAAANQILFESCYHLTYKLLFVWIATSPYSVSMKDYSNLVNVA